MEQKKESKFFYGWVIVFAIGCLQGAAIGIIGNTMSVFIRPVSTAMGVARSVFLLTQTIGMLAGLVMSPIWGEFFKNRRFKPWMILGAIAAGGSIYCNSYATKMWHLYALAAVRSSMQGMLTGVPIARILSNWFVEKRGTATGLALAGSGLAGSIVTPIVSRTIETLGWQAGYRQVGLMFFAITAPVLLLLLRENPADMGLKPYGYKENVEVKVISIGLKSGMSRAQAFRSKTYWHYIVGLFVVQGCTMSISNNVVNHLTDIGYSPAFAARIFSLLLFMLVPGKPVLGYIYDKLGIRAGTIFATVMVGVSPILLAMTAIFRHLEWMPYAFALWFGFAYSIASMQLPYMTPKLFGDKEFTRVYGVCQPFMSLGSALVVPFANRIQESIGSYVPIFFSLSVGFAVALFLMLQAIKFSPIEIAKFDAEDGLISTEAATHG